MMEIIGKYNNAIVYTDELEPSAGEQIKAFCDIEASAGSRIRIMPDVHAGAGCAIGTTMTIKDKVVPNLVGVDIGCGMETVLLKEKRLELSQLDKLIYKLIPSGFGVRSTPHKYANSIELERLKCANHIKLNRAYVSIGTLGGGNHFIEIDKDDAGQLYLVVHSGSRHLGLEIANYYQKKAAANKKDKGISNALAHVEGADFDDYLFDMHIAQEFAKLNRNAMIDEILNGLKLKAIDRFITTHNYIDLNDMVLRKGAISAKQGEMILVPINMRDGALICEGKGNADWNQSAPHGAGRLMSRKEAKQSFTVNAFKKEMDGIFTSSVNHDTLDECPMAYKSMDYIINHIAPTAEVRNVIKPIYNFKAGNE